MTAQTTDAPAVQAWQQPCAQPRRTFQYGTRVKHRRPGYADWRGVVMPDAAGQYMRLSKPFDGAVMVHVRWTSSFGPVEEWAEVTTIAVATLSDAAVCVARGVALLDEREPGWDKLVDLDMLRMGDTSWCVAAQTWTGPYDLIASPFTQHMRALFPSNDNTEIVAHGFDAYLDDGASLDELAAEWERVILARREAAAR